MNEKKKINKVDNNPINTYLNGSSMAIAPNSFNLEQPLNSLIWNQKEKFVNLLMKDGKKTKASKIFFEMLWFLKRRIQGQASLVSINQGFQKNIVFLKDGDKDVLKSENLPSERDHSADLSTLYHFSQGLQNIMPTLEVRKVRVSGSTYLVPAILYKRRQESLAIKWIIESAKKKQKTSKSNFAQCLADELYDALKKQGQARQKRDELHRLALANRAYTRYRWW